MALASLPSHAQYVLNYQTNIVAAGTDTWSGAYIVGSNTFADALLIEDNGMLSSQSGVLGYTAASTNNGVVVSGTGSVWTVEGPLYTGFSGAGNGLVIRNGGQIANGAAYVGYNPGSSNNTVLVSDPGSLWNNNGAANFFFGYSGAGNSLIISNGGSVTMFSGYQSFVGYNASSSNNAVVITGSGSVWSNEDLYFGYWGSSNSLVVASGGKLAVTYGFFEMGPFGSANSLVVSNGGQVLVSNGFVDGTNNSVLITGTGSVWSNGYDLELVSYGARDTLVISNGGLVVDNVANLGGSSNGSSMMARVADGAIWRNTSLSVGNQGQSNSLVVAGGSVYAASLVVGAASATCDNILELDSGSVIVTNAGATGALEVRDGQLILKGGTLQADTLVITNSCAQFMHTGGTLLVSNIVLDPNTFRIVSVTPQTNDMLVTWMMGPGITNALQAATGAADGSYTTNAFTDIFIVTNNPSAGTVTNYLDLGVATNGFSRFYRARLDP